MASIEQRPDGKWLVTKWIDGQMVTREFDKKSDAEAWAAQEDAHGI